MADGTSSAAGDELRHLLASNYLLHLHDTLTSQTTFSELAAMTRAEVLVRLKALGVEKLGERQKLASAIAKTARMAATLATSTAATPPPPPKRDIKPQGFQIYCHNTTLDDGTLLSNDEPTPEFIIEELEKRTGIARPDAALTLHETQLHFINGGRSTQ